MKVQLLALALLSAGLSLHAAAPVNDNIASRIIVPTNQYVSVTGSNVDATKETNEKNHQTGIFGNGNSGGRSVWWQWRCPVAGSYIITTAGSSFDTVLAMYNGPTTHTGMALQGADDDGVSPVYRTVRTSLIAMNLAANNNYYIAVDGISNAVGGAESGTIQLTIRPNNDDVAGRVTLTGATVQTNGWNGRATAEGPSPANTEPQRLGGFVTQSEIGKTVWWQWSPPTNGQYLITTIGSDFDTVLIVCTNTASPTAGTMSKATDAVPNPDYDSGSFVSYASLASINAKTNLTYYIAVDGQTPEGVGDPDFNDAGQILLSIYPDNNRFTNRTRITGTSYTGRSANGVATIETGAGLNENQIIQNATSVDTSITPNGKTVWWSWVAPTNGRALLNTAGSDFDTILAVYAGTNLATAENANWRFIGWDNDGGTLFDSALDVGVLPGVEYQFQVLGNYAAGSDDDGYGIVQFSLSFVPGPTNDLFATRALLTGSNVTAMGTSINSTKEFGEGAHGAINGGKSVWWKWTAASSGPVTMTTSGSDFDTVLSVYTGTVVSNLTLKAQNNDETEGVPASTLTFEAIAGTEYAIAVDGDDEAGEASFGNVVLSITQITAPPNDHFAAAIPLAGSTANAATATANSTKEPGEPNHAGDTGGSSIWWTWTPPFNGIARIYTGGSSYDTVLAVYTGTVVSNLTLVAQNNDADALGGDVASEVVINAESNTTYRIVVDGIDGTVGNATLSIVLSIRPVVTAPARQPDGSISLNFSAINGRSYEVQESDDLVVWATLQTVTASGGTVSFNDATAIGQTRRFYRIVEQ
jgi:hypothetical protein